MANGTFPVWHPGLRVLLAAAFGITMTVVVVISAWYSESRLGAPLYWTWVLTGIQVLALWAAGRRLWWAWLLGAAVQLPWIAYALLTDQHGFVPGCLLSAAVQIWTLTRHADRDRSDCHPPTAAGPTLGRTRGEQETANS